MNLLHKRTYQALSSMLLIIFCFGCNDQSKKQPSPKELYPEYLELKEFYVPYWLSEEDENYIIFNEAIERIGMYEENHIIKFKHERAEDVNMSEETFNYVKSFSEYTNYLKTKDTMWYNLYEEHRKMVDIQKLNEREKLYNAKFSLD